MGFTPVSFGSARTAAERLMRKRVWGWIAYLHDSVPVHRIGDASTTPFP